MKILHLNTYLSWHGGVETYLLSLLPKLEARDHRQVVVFAEGDGTLASRSRHVPSLKQAGRRANQEGRDAIARLLREESPDVVHLHQTFNLGAIQACLDAVPTVMTAHDYRYVCPSSSFYHQRTEEVCDRRCGPMCFAVTLRKHCLTLRPKYAGPYYRLARGVARRAPRFAAVLAPSEYARGRFLQAGFSSECVVTLPHPCTLAPSAGPRRVPAQPTLLFAGRLHPSKGYNYFVDALGHLPTRVRGILVGNLTPPREREIRRRAEIAGCQDRLELRPWVGREAIRSLFQEASVLVFPSLAPETLGLVGLEAMACGVPVVASDVGGVREWLQDGRTGFLVPPKSGEAIAQRAATILDSEELNCRMGRNGLGLVREKFSPDLHLKRLLDVYQKAGG